MKKIIFKCQSVTALKMYGANKALELRPTSFKGIIRFWWRAINGDLKWQELRKEENKIFGSLDKKSTFSILIPKYDLQGSIINEGFEFDIKFIQNGDFDIKSFFELVVILGLFGQKGKGSVKTQGAIKIIEIDNNKYSQKIDINYIYKLLKRFNNNYEIKNNKVFIAQKQKYPLVSEIGIKGNDLLITFENFKIKTIKKNLEDYNNE